MVRLRPIRPGSVIVIVGEGLPRVAQPEAEPARLCRPRVGQWIAGRFAAHLDAADASQVRVDRFGYCRCHITASRVRGRRRGGGGARSPMMGIFCTRAPVLSQ